MKKLVLSLIVIFSAVSLFATEKIIYTEDFEQATVGATTLGNANAMNYGGNAVWTFGLEETYPISGKKSAYFNVSNTGSEWWTLQYRIDSKFEVIQGYDYRISFKIQSSVANTIMFKVQDTHDFTQTLNLKGGYDTESYSILVPKMDRSAGTSNFMFAFGTPAVPAEMWLDDIVIEEIAKETGIEKNTVNKLKACALGNTLQINVSEPCSVKVFDLLGQTLTSEPVNISDLYSIKLPDNANFVLVKATYKDKSTECYKVPVCK